MPAHPLTLLRHPHSPRDALEHVAAGLRRAPDGGLRLDFALRGDIAGVRIPEGALDGERLWAHSCFELFVAADGATAYREFNFSPNGQWMRFDFSAYRQRVILPAAAPPPSLAFARGEGWAGLTVDLPRAQLPAGALAIGLSAVVELDDGRHAYWALHHPAGRPDFHHRAGRVLALPSI